MMLLALLMACSGGDDAAPTEEGPTEAPTTEQAATVAPAHQSLFKPLPERADNPDNPITPEKVALGRMLYYDTRLSIGKDISCNSCHLLDAYGVDGEPTSPGHEGQRGNRNSPTVYNAAFHVDQFWDGRATDVEEQAKGPVLNPVEMGMPDEAFVERQLNAVPGYLEHFQAAFPDDDQPIDYDNMARAIGAFERQLVTPAPFDDYLKGDASALTVEQREGLDLFVATGCTTCHMGATLGGTTYQKMGLFEPYETEDLGRFDVTGKEADRYVFKVPSLRNITETAPYFHDGGVGSLEEAVSLMGKHQLGKELTDEQVGSIVSFLGSLKGEIPKDYIAKPELPE